MLGKGVQRSNVSLTSYGPVYEQTWGVAVGGALCIGPSGFPMETSLLSLERAFKIRASSSGVGWGDFVLSLQFFHWTQTGTKRGAQGRILCTIFPDGC